MLLRHKGQNLPKTHHFVVKGISVCNTNPDEAPSMPSAKEQNFAAEKVELIAVEVKEND